MEPKTHLNFVCLFHGTSQSNWPSIELTGIKKGSSFASDPAFAVVWAIDRFGEQEAIVIEAKISQEQANSLSSEIRAFPVRCTQWTIPQGVTIGPEGLRKCSSEEMKPHIAYAKEQVAKSRRNKTDR